MKNFELDIVPFWNKQKELYTELDSWTICVNRRLKKVLGRCDPNLKKIEISEIILNFNDVYNVILHEIAHAISFERYPCDPRHDIKKGHGPLWIEACDYMGIKPERYCSNMEIVNYIAERRFKYSITCNNCKDVSYTNKNIMSEVYTIDKCNKCGHNDNTIIKLK